MAGRPGPTRGMRDGYPRARTHDHPGHRGQPPSPGNPSARTPARPVADGQARVPCPVTTAPRRRRRRRRSGDPGVCAPGSIHVRRNLGGAISATPARPRGKPPVGPGAGRGIQGARNTVAISRGKPPSGREARRAGNTRGWRIRCSVAYPVQRRSSGRPRGKSAMVAGTNRDRHCTNRGVEHPPLGPVRSSRVGAVGSGFPRVRDGARSTGMGEHQDGRRRVRGARGAGTKGTKRQGTRATAPRKSGSRGQPHRQRSVTTSGRRLCPRAGSHRARSGTTAGGGPWRARIAARDERGTGKDRSIGRTARAGSDDDRSRGTNGTSGERRGPVAWVERAMHREEACRGWRAAMARGAMQERGSAPGERGS